MCKKYVPFVLDYIYATGYLMNANATRTKKCKYGSKLHTKLINQGNLLIKRKRELASFIIGTVNGFNLPVPISHADWYNNEFNK